MCNLNNTKMKKLIILISILLFGILCQAQTKQDSLVPDQISKEVIEKLSNEELINLIKDVEYMKYNRGITLQDDKKMFLIQHLNSRTFIIGLIISIMIFIILLISIPFYFNVQKTKSFHRMIKGFVEKGQEIPNELILSVPQAKSDLRRSVILISTGIAISLVLILISSHGRIWSIGIIPIVIGIGYLVSSRLDK